METFDMEIRSEGDMEFFLNSLETQLNEKIESHFILEIAHAEWSNILLDNIEADARYQVPKGTEPFIDCTFVYPTGDDTKDTASPTWLDNLLEQLDSLEDLDDEDDDYEGDDND